MGSQIDPTPPGTTVPGDHPYTKLFEILVAPQSGADWLTAGIFWLVVGLLIALGVRIPLYFPKIKSTRMGRRPVLTVVLITAFGLVLSYLILRALVLSD